MTLPPINKKSFTLINRISKTFQIAIDNFAYAATLLFRVRSKITLSFSPIFTILSYVTVRLRRVRIIISQVKLITSLTQTINLRRVRFVYSTKQIGKLFATITQKLPISFISSARQKIVSNILLRRVTLVLDPVLAQFFTLGDYDPDTLGTLDTLTLGEMDYVVT